MKHTLSPTNSEKERAKLQNAQVLFCLKNQKRTFCGSVHSKLSKKLADRNAGYWPKMKVTIQFKLRANLGKF